MRMSTPAEQVRSSRPSGRGFDLRVREPYDGVAHTRLYQVIDASGRPVPGPRIAVVGHMHGNEPVGRYTLERFDEHALGNLVCGEVLAILANPLAMEMNLRHTPEGRDLNRLWDRASIERIRGTDDADLCYEERRARALYPLLETCDAILDLHSTSRPSPTHLVFRDDLRHASIAAKLGVSRLVTGVHEGGILDGGLCSNFGLRPGEVGQQLGFTLEAGQHDNRDNDENAWNVLVRLLVELGQWGGDVPASEVPFEVYEVQGRFRQAPAGAEPYRFVGFVGGEAGAGRFGPPRLLESFERIEADEVVLRRGTEVVRAVGPFTMLMPAPTAGPGDDLFYFTNRRHAALRRRPQSDEAATLEASAIEQTLDLLSWDELERGATRLSFTARLTLDACADMITRATRLPPGHPHRCITVVGRGDWERDEDEQRAGRRYQAAMSRALADGVPVERIQLIRGAASGWLQHLSSGELDGDLRMFLAPNQPHTVSLLVVGDLERATRRGELRHIAVGLVVEATTVEPDGEGARTRIARTGLFGARPELVRTASAFIGAMRARHRHLLATSTFGVRAREAGLLDADCAIRASGAEQRQLLHDLLKELQQRSWQDSLRHEVTREVRLSSPEAVGGWLARTMASTGILDGDALRDLLLEEDGDGWRVVPTGDDVRIELNGTEPPPRSVAPVLLDARDVDRENIERWMGWLRAVRGLEVVPGSRGKDVDLALRPDDIQERLATWYDDVRDLARKEPGRWTVVVAGDGSSPERDGRPAARRVLAAHRELVRDPGVGYVRVQHAAGTHLSWLKGFFDDLAERPPGATPIAMGWEAEHGATVNVVLVARAEEVGRRDPWSLEGLQIARCAVIVSDLEGGGANDYQVAMFTGGKRAELVSQELLAFGRAHCRGLLRQASRRVSGVPGPFLRVNLERVVVGLVARHVERVRELADALEDVAPRARVDWLRRRLGLLDTQLVAALAASVGDEAEPSDTARQIWSQVVAWRGGTVRSDSL